jgi:long-chain acyl-CoA synthetase
MNNQRTIFLTGATGTLGQEIIKELVTETQDRLYVLIRPKKRQSPKDRLDKILKTTGSEYDSQGRIQVLEGDITSTSFGLEAKDLKMLRGEVDHFFHIAAYTTLNGSRDRCYRINLDGTKHALALARDFHDNGKLDRFYYFSTAFVAGSRHTFRATEDDIPENPAHANYYEASKCEAETLVRDAILRSLPATIFRPSIVVGNSVNGEVSEFNVIYPFMKLYAHGILKRLPTRLENSFNIVPIDFVTKASLEIASQKDSIGKTYHLVTLSPPTIGTLLKLQEDKYPGIGPIEVIDPEEFIIENLSPDEQVAFNMLEPYMGYLNDHLTFDARNTIGALQGTGIEMPKTDYRFLEIILNYAFQKGYLYTTP